MISGFGVVFVVAGCVMLVAAVVGVVVTIALASAHL